MYGHGHEDIILTPEDIGCHLDNHRGHYITRDAIEIAVAHGFIIDGFARYALDAYHEHWHNEDYPHEELYDLCRDAIAWLNDGRDNYPDARMPGQNWPPIVPDGAYWTFNDGDFGLYMTDDDGEII